MENSGLFEEIQNVMSMLDADVYPEVPACLGSVIDPDTEEILKDPYDIATDLLACDEPEDLPPVVIDLITELYRFAFDNGNPDAMNDLGAQYYDGHRGFEQNFSKALYCYELAARNGSRQAQENLGYCYYYGRDVEVDYKKAFHYFALGAFDGHAISLYKIGDMYANGYYVEKNEKEAFHIYEHCAATMDEESAKRIGGPVYLRLGNCFMNGRGTAPDAEIALICYQKAEVLLYDMVRSGDSMYKKSLYSARDGQEKARKILEDALPSRSWPFDS